MANDYYENSVTLTPFDKAKSTDIDGDFNGIEDGFDRLPAPHANAPGTKGFSEAYVNVAGTDETHATNIKQIRDGGFFVGADNSSSANAYAITLTPAPAAYTTNMIVMFKVPTGLSNTGACTLDCNSLGAKSIKSGDGGNPGANELYTGNYAWCQYNGTDFQLIFPSMASLSSPTNAIPAASTPAYTSLRTNSAGTAYEIGQSVNYKNRVFNSECMIDQEFEGAATVFSGAGTANGYGIDGYKTWIDGSGAVLSVQQTTGVGGLRNSIKVTATTLDAGDAGGIVIPFEHLFLGYDVADFVNGATVNISFYFQSNHAAGSVFSVSLQAGNSGYSYVTDFTLTSPGTPQLVSKTITIPAHASNYISNTTTGIGLRLSVANVCGSSKQGTADQWNSADDLCSANRTNWTEQTGGAVDGYVQMSGLQLRVGENHVPLEMKSRAEYLRECKRFYQKSYAQGTKTGTVSLVGAAAARAVGAVTGFDVNVNFTDTMIASPTVTLYSTQDGASGNVYNVTTGPANAAVSSVQLIGDSGFAYLILTGAQTDGDYLRFHWEADARL